jgi:hypothetical protein
MITIELHADRQWKPWCLSVANGKSVWLWWFRTRQELCMMLPEAMADYEKRVMDNATEI